MYQQGHKVIYSLSLGLVFLSLYVWLQILLSLLHLCLVYIVLVYYLSQLSHFIELMSLKWLPPGIGLHLRIICSLWSVTEETAQGSKMADFWHLKHFASGAGHFSHACFPFPHLHLPRFLALLFVGVLVLYPFPFWGPPTLVHSLNYAHL